MADNIFDDRQLLLEYYKTQAEEYQWRFQAIWDAMRHYTWLLSILLGWPVVAFLNKDLNTIRTSLLYLFLASVLGLIFSIIAFFVVHKAYYFYNDLEARLLYIEKKLGLTSEPDFLDSRREKAVGKVFSVKKYIKSSQSIRTFISLNVKIRTLFLSGFIAFAVVSIIEIISCWRYLFS